MELERKSLDVILQEAFKAGVRHGARYPEFAAIPEWESEAQFLAFKADLQGNPWGPEEWRLARARGVAEERADLKMLLTESERATYQSLRARGFDHETAREDALDGVSVEDLREGKVRSNG